MKGLPIRLIAALFAAGIAASPAMAGFEPIEASIPFVNQGAIRDWQAIDRDTLYVQDIQHHWYRAELMGGCLDLPYVNAIGFDARGTNRFDRFGSIVVGRQNCALKSFVASGPPLPPEKRKKVG